MCVKSITLIATQTCVSDTHEYVCDPQLVPYMTCSRLDNRHTMECKKIGEAAITTVAMYVTMCILRLPKKNTFKYQKDYRLCVHGTYDTLYVYAL